MKIFIRGGCHWVDDGFAACVRGEARWSLNIAQLLAKLGNDVVFGVDENRSKLPPPKNVTICESRNERNYGKFDLYIDPSWGFTGGRLLADSKFYLAMFWYREYYGKVEPKWLIKLYPYSWVKSGFDDVNPNDGTFFQLSLPFGDKFISPTENKRNLAMVPFNGVTQSSPEACGMAKRILTHLASKKLPIQAFIVDPDFFKTHFGNIPYSGIGYDLGLNRNKLIENYSRGLISTPVFGQSCTAEAIFRGCPTLEWEDKWYHQVSDRHGLTVKRDKPGAPSNVIEVIDRLLNDEKVRNDYVLDFQNELSEHLECNVIQQFNHIVKSLGV